MPRERHQPAFDAPPRMARRAAIELGALSAVSLALPNLLSAGEPANAANQTDPPRHQPREKSCIFICLSGGPSHVDMFDMKPDQPEEIRGQYRPIATSVPSIQICEMMPRIASLAHHYCLLRSLSHTVIPHIEAAHVCLSGQSDGGANNNAPYFGSVMARVRPSPPEVPSYVWLHRMLTGTRKWARHDSGGLLGQAYAPIRVGEDLDNPSQPGFRVRVFDPPEGVAVGDVRRRYQLLGDLRAARAAGAPADVAMEAAAQADFAKHQANAVDLVTRPMARRAFDLNEEPASVRERYGWHPLGQYLLMARRLIESGVRLVGVSGCTGAPPDDPNPPIRQMWDMHDDYYIGNDNMYGRGLYGMAVALPRLDQAFSALIADMAARGLLDDTLVVLVGEFGRTPRFEGKGRGRGHWPFCYTGLLAGAGVRGGAVYGASDKIGAYVAKGRVIRPEDFGATVYHALGVPANTRPDPNNLGLRVSAGEPVYEIFS